jgi:TonB family protein
LPAVRPDNQALLGAPTYRAFAQYLNAMHNRLHPVFADSFLGSLEQLPCDNPLSDPKLATELEIVVAPDGHIARIGVVKPSGMTTFDVGTLVAVRRAAPFEPTPPAIQSTDGNLYLRWKFQRDEVFSCTTMNARPFRLNSTSTTP